MWPLTSREACSMSPEGVALRTKTCGIGPIRAHHRPKSKRLDTSKQKSSPTNRHKTTPEQFKHIFATNLHGPQWPQSRSKLTELTSGAVQEQVLDQESHETGAQTRQLPIADVSFTMAKLMLSQNGGIFGIERASCGL